MELGSAPDAEPATVAPFRPMQAIVGLGAVQAITMAAGLARTKVLAMLLGPAGVGVASVIDQAVSLVAQLGSVSIPFVALKYMSRAHGAGALEERHRIYRALGTTLALAVTVAATIAVVVAAWRPGVFGDGLTPYRAAVLVALAGVPPFAIGPMLRNVMAALDRHRDAALAALLTAVLSVAGSYLGVSGGGLVGLYIANGVVSIIAVLAMRRYIAGAFQLGRDGPAERASTVSTLREQPGLLRFAGAMYVLALTSPVAYLLARSTLLSTHGAVEAGWVAAAYGIAVSVRLVLHQANGLYLTPLVNRDAPKAERLTIVAEYVRILVVLVVCSVLIIALFPRQVLLVLYSAHFIGALPYVTLFLLAETVLLLAGVYQALLIGFDDISGHLASTVSGHLLTITLAYVLIPRFGGAGVGGAFLAGNAVILVGTATRVWRAHNGRVAFAPLVPMLIAFSAIGGAGWWAAQPGGHGLAWRIGLYVGAVGVALAFLRRDERRWLFGMWRGVLPGARGS